MKIARCPMNDECTRVVQVGPCCYEFFVVVYFFFFFRTVCGCCSTPSKCHTLSIVLEKFQSGVSLKSI